MSLFDSFPVFNDLNFFFQLAAFTGAGPVSERRFNTIVAEQGNRFLAPLRKPCSFMSVTNFTLFVAIFCESLNIATVVRQSKAFKAPLVPRL